MDAEHGRRGIGIVYLSVVGTCRRWYRRFECELGQDVLAVCAGDDAGRTDEEK